jgi:hypothetical protein
MKYQRQDLEDSIHYRQYKALREPHHRLMNDEWVKVLRNIEETSQGGKRAKNFDHGADPE